MGAAICVGDIADQLATAQEATFAVFEDWLVPPFCERHKLRWERRFPGRYTWQVLSARWTQPHKYQVALRQKIMRIEWSSRIVEVATTKAKLLKKRL